MSLKDKTWLNYLVIKHDIMQLGIMLIIFAVRQEFGLNNGGGGKTKGFLQPWRTVGHQCHVAVKKAETILRFTGFKISFKRGKSSAIEILMWKQRDSGHPVLKKTPNNNEDRLGKYYSDDQEKGEPIFCEPKINGFLAKQNKGWECLWLNPRRKHQQGKAFLKGWHWQEKKCLWIGKE